MKISLTTLQRVSEVHKQGNNALLDCSPCLMQTQIWQNEITLNTYYNVG